MNKTQLEQVKKYLQSLQQSICSGIEAEANGDVFIRDEWQYENGGGGVSKVITGETIEKGGVNFSHIKGKALPASATIKRPEIAGKPFEAMGVSVVIHPKNPYVPTSHANVRLFVADPDGDKPVWWFGGGYDLTPFYPEDEDIVFWHQTAKEACDRIDERYYPRYKAACDEYFYLPHRQETRGVGGLFFDDFSEQGFEHAFGFMRSVGDSFIKAYQPIISKRKSKAFGKKERDFQAVRRGRYVEYNLLYDRGTIFGLQSGGRTESILMSLPPMVQWHYCVDYDAGSAEAKLAEYLKPRDWLK